MVQRDQAAILTNITQIIEDNGGKLRAAFAALAPFDALSIVECDDEAQLNAIDDAVNKQGLYTVDNYRAIPISDFISTVNTQPIFLEAWLKARDQEHTGTLAPSTIPSSKPPKPRKK